MPAEEADILFSELTDKPVTDSIPRLFNTERPNIIMIILESFSSHLMETLGGEPGIAVNMDEFAKEGYPVYPFLCQQLPHRPGLGIHH